MPAPSYSYNISTNRDGIIARALRLIGGIGQGETPTAIQITEGAEALNDLVKSWQADGMPLWCLKTYGGFAFTQGTASYTVGVSGQTWNNSSYGAPLRVLQVWQRTNNYDSPVNLITREQYNLMGAKATQGTPSLYWYNPPGELTSAAENIGTMTVYPTPDADAAANHTCYFTGVRGFADFDSSTDVPDFPQTWFNAIKWGLAVELSFDYGVSATDRAQIAKKAEKEKEQALSAGSEEGSIFFHPSSYTERY